MRDDASPATGTAPPSSTFPAHAVREWAARLHEQELARRDASPRRLAWPFAVAAALLVGALAVAVPRLVASGWAGLSDGGGFAFGAVVVLVAATVGLLVGGALRLRQARRRLEVARRRPATVGSLPAAARDLVLDSPQLRYRLPRDAPGFAAARDAVARSAQVGPFAAGVLVWALAVDGREDGTLEHWLRCDDA
ncbi:hypothetical protein [Terrabacter sp. NPDC000476]|uniref:hypothetical protein n=1 Tax=Terrabacter sp. NPDC000476 TaxID=3154258 RepID=UPI003334A721